MTRFIDARIPVLFNVEPGPGDHVLQTTPDWIVDHAPSCTCCGARGAAAVALDRLFLDRVLGKLPWFDRVVVLGDGEAVMKVLAEDGIVVSRYRWLS